MSKLNTLKPAAVLMHMRHIREEKQQIFFKVRTRRAALQVPTLHGDDQWRTKEIARSTSVIQSICFYLSRFFVSFEVNPSCGDFEYGTFLYLL